MPADQLLQWTRPQTAPLIVSGRFALQKALHPVALKTTDRQTDGQTLSLLSPITTASGGA